MQNKPLTRTDRLILIIGYLLGIGAVVYCGIQAYEYRCYQDVAYPPK